MQSSTTPRIGSSRYGIADRDGPETIRMRKYATGTHVLLEELGIVTGATPREVVWAENKARLYRYSGTGGERRAVPLLLVYGFVLKPYILDLVPGNSLVEYLVQEGFDVYLLDFGVSGREDAGLGLDDLVLDYLPAAVEQVLATSGATEISLLGQSQGGTLSAIYAALFPDGPLENLVLLSAPTDFAPRNPGPFGLWTLGTRNSGPFFDPGTVPRLIGNLPTDVASAFIDSAAALQATAVEGRRPAVRPSRHGLRSDARSRPAPVGVRRLHAFVARREQVGRRRRAVSGRDVPNVGGRPLPAQRARHGPSGAPRNHGGPVRHPVRRPQRLRPVGLRRPALPDPGHDAARRRPGSAIRGAERRPRRHARRAGGRGQPLPGLLAWLGPRSGPIGPQ